MENIKYESHIFIIQKREREENRYVIAFLFQSKS